MAEEEALNGGGEVDEEEEQDLEEDSEDDEAAGMAQRACLPVCGDPLPTTESLPATADEYLRQVQWERERLPGTVDAPVCERPSRRRRLEGSDPAVGQEGESAPRLDVVPFLDYPVPFLDFAPEFIERIASGAKRATARCPGGSKDTDKTSNFPAILQQGWALATCSTQSKTFAVLGVDKVEQRALGDVDDKLAAVEGMESGEELRAAMKRFYPLITHEDLVKVLHFHVIRLIPQPVSSGS